MTRTMREASSVYYKWDVQTSAKSFWTKKLLNGNQRSSIQKT